MIKTTKKVKKTLVINTGNVPEVFEEAKRLTAYEATIKILGKIHKATGSTIREAIENLKPEGKTAGMSVLTLSKGEVSKERILNNNQTFRLFCASKLMREIALKNISLLFDL